MMMSLGKMKVVVCVVCKSPSVEIVPGLWSCPQCDAENGEEQTRGLSLVDED
jgi:ribosomal protein L37AE/L43A